MKTSDVAKKSDIALMKNIIPLWHAQKQWGEVLLKTSLGLKKAEDILTSFEYREDHEVPGTKWIFRPSGKGVDIFDSNNKGGINFDFDKPNPCIWRLGIFFKRQYNDDKISHDLYYHIYHNQDILKAASVGALIHLS